LPSKKNEAERGIVIPSEKTTQLLPRRVPAVRSTAEVSAWERQHEQAEASRCKENAEEKGKETKVSGIACKAHAASYAGVRQEERVALHPDEAVEGGGIKGGRGRGTKPPSVGYPLVRPDALQVGKEWFEKSRGEKPSVMKETHRCPVSRSRCHHSTDRRDCY
jgi:hypothetical protein